MTKTQVKPKLVWLASYPKSGNTWFRIFLTNYLRNAQTPTSFNELETDSIASSRFCFNQAYGEDSCDLTADEIDARRPALYDLWVSNANETRFHKTHDAYTYLADGTPLMGQPKDQAAIYFIRNPLDVAVSFSYHSGHENFAKTIEEMANADFCLSHHEKKFALQLRQKLLTWSQHVTSWQNANLPKLFLRYEDMLADPVAEFGKAITFLQMDYDQARLEQAIQFSDIKTLQALEKEAPFKEKPTKAKQFFRQGQANTHQAKLTSQQIGKVIRDHFSVMQTFGYLPALAQAQ